MQMQGARGVCALRALVLICVHFDELIWERLKQPLTIKVYTDDGRQENHIFVRKLQRNNTFFGQLALRFDVRFKRLG